MYFDMYLKFDTEADATAALFDEEKPKYAAIDVIGVIYKPTGIMLTTDEGEVPEMAPLDGWHANVRHTEEAPELEVHRVFPAAPVRMWA